MGYTRTNHRLNYSHKANPLETISTLQTLMGVEKANEYLADYPTANLKLYAADVMIRHLREEKARNVESV
jgi:hypothetical protein